MGALASIFLLITVLAANALQILSLVIRPFSRTAFREVNCAIAGAWWSLCVRAGRDLQGAKLVLTGDPLPAGRENAIVIANHQQMADIYVLMMLAHRARRLRDLKWFVKDPIKYVPGIGWGMLFIDCIFLKRNWDADRSKIDATFSKLKRDAIPVWLISFVEGTRVRPEKLERSREFARSRGLPELKNVLFPRSKGFAATVQGLQGHVTAIYDVTIGFTGGVPSLWDVASGRSREFHAHIRRFPAAGLPADLSAWLIERFREKDALMDRFKATGSFA